jgi:hypothetical protein
VDANTSNEPAVQGDMLNNTLPLLIICLLGNQAFNTLVNDVSGELLDDGSMKILLEVIEI